MRRNPHGLLRLVLFFACLSFGCAPSGSSDLKGSSDQGLLGSNPPPNPATLTGQTKTVGPGKQYSTISAAVQAAADGDTVNVDPGVYTNDFPPTITKQLLIQGVGGRPQIIATQAVPNRKAIFVVDANLTLKNLEITGAFVSDSDGANGAAIRFEAGNLLVDSCYVHGNQDGVMGAPGTGEIMIYSSEFSQNGVTDPNTYPSGYGYTHNIYVKVSKLTVSYSYVFAASAGHNVKSRSLSTIISHSVIADGSSGTASYSIDISNGGQLLVEHSVIEKGPQASNKPFIAFAMEGATNPNGSITVDGNLFIDDFGSASVIANNTSTSATLTSNEFDRITLARLGSGSISQSGSTFSTTSAYAAAFWTTSVPSPWPAP